MGQLQIPKPSEAPAMILAHATPHPPSRFVPVVDGRSTVPVYAIRTPDDLEYVASVTKPESSQPFGQFLLQRKLLTPEELNEALAMQRRMSGRRIGWIIKTLGIFDDVTLGRLLAAHHGIACVSLAKYEAVADFRQRLPGMTMGEAGMALLHEGARKAWLALSDVGDLHGASAVADALGKGVAMVMAPQCEILAFARSDRRNAAESTVAVLNLHEEARRRHLASLGLPADAPVAPGLCD